MSKSGAKKKFYLFLTNNDTTHNATQNQEKINKILFERNNFIFEVYLARV
jgi:hypothetical protein